MQSPTRSKTRTDAGFNQLGFCLERYWVSSPAAVSKYQDLTSKRRLLRGCRLYFDMRCAPSKRGSSARILVVWPKRGQLFVLEEMFMIRVVCGMQSESEIALMTVAYNLLRSSKLYKLAIRLLGVAD